MKIVDERKLSETKPVTKLLEGKSKSKAKESLGKFLTRFICPVIDDVMVTSNGGIPTVWAILAISSLTTAPTELEWSTVVGMIGGQDPNTIILYKANYLEFIRVCVGHYEREVKPKSQITIIIVDDPLPEMQMRHPRKEYPRYPQSNI
jgi:hypothetical protein